MLILAKNIEIMQRQEPAEITKILVKNVYISYLISYPDLTLFYTEKWDLVKVDTRPFFIGSC